MSSHIPVNHPLRSLYRALAAFVGLYVLIFGIVAATRTSGTPAFSQDHLRWVLGLRTNLGFALLSVAAGVVLLAAVAIGRNVDRFVNIWGSLVFMGVGVVMLGLMRTNANVLGFSMANCIVSFVFGTVLLAAGLYGRTARSGSGAGATV